MSDQERPTDTIHPGSSVDHIKAEWSFELDPLAWTLFKGAVLVSLKRHHRRLDVVDLTPVADFATSPEAARVQTVAMPPEHGDGGRTCWAHLEVTRINITPTILRHQIEDFLSVVVLPALID